MQLAAKGRREIVKPQDRPQKDTTAPANVEGLEFENVYHRYYPAIFTYAMRATLNVAAAEDIVSETFLKAFRGYKNLRGGPGALQGWLYRIATNTMMDYFRRSARTPVVATPVDELAERYLVAGESPGSAIQRLEDYRRLHGVIALLPHVYRLTIVLHYFEGQSVREIATIMKCTAVTVRWRLFQARKRLAARLGVNLETDTNDY
ncbi:MAG: ECF RNA polymerase sigma factor SigH [Candidatus Hydrogenedentota bacterium]